MRRRRWRAATTRSETRLPALSPISAAPTPLEHAVLDRPPRDEPELLYADAQRHLGMTAHAIGERDRHLRDAVAVLPNAVAELDLEAVPLRTHLLVARRLEHIGAKRAVTRGGVADRDAEHQRGVTVAPLRDRPPVPGPVRDRSAGNVARPDRGVG